jgi:transcriptional regulator with GAF, ATPase, and Fis domain
LGGFVLQISHGMQLEALQSLALSVAAARSPEEVLKQVVQGLGMTEGVALARVWLLRRPAAEQPFLELKASIGASNVHPDVRWNRTDGAHQRIPLSYGKVGRIADSNQPLLLQRGARDWLMQPEWAEIEGIESFAGQPLSFKGEVLGVVAFFSRKRLEKHDLKWLRVFADHAAVAVANTRAYEQIERLKESAERERDYLRAAVRTALQHGEIVAESAAMQDVLAQARAVAQSKSSVLILGESGVGKELIAAAVHDMSPRRDGPLVKVNCASIPRELFESEFFGHVRGAFSGATRDRQGRFALADGGTLFLDEVGEIPLLLQGKLLRVLQEGSLEAVGDDQTRYVDVRVIAATNRPLEAEVEAGAFRRDLYYRLSVLPIHVPPLRQRREDILPMARRFMAATAQRLNLPMQPLSPAYERALAAYDFPGNVRELQNIIERALVLRREELGGLDFESARSAPEQLPGAAVSSAALSDAALADAALPAGAALKGALPGVTLPEATLQDLPGEVAAPQGADAAVLTFAQLRALERRNLLRALALSRFQIAGPRGAARLLGINPSTLSYRLKQLGIERPK